MSEKQKEIFQSVLSTERVITKELHDEFWKDVPAQFRAETGAFLIRFTELNMLNLNEFEDEGWRSVKISIQSRTPCITIKYLKIKERILQESENTSGFAKGSAENSIYVDRLKKRLDVSYNKTLSWIEASAAGSPVIMDTGEKVILTIQMMDQAIASGQGMKRRLLKLLNPVWQ